MEVERIYHDVCKSAVRSVAITSASAEEGVSSIAQSLTQRFLLSGHSTVLVDLNLHRPNLSTQLEFRDDGNMGKPSGSSTHSSTLLNAPSLAGGKNSHLSLVGITAPKQRAAILKLRNPGELERCIQELHCNFDYIIFDTSSISRVNKQNIPAERVASACEACYLVVQAGITDQKTVQSAVSTLAHANANLIGCIINDMNNPSLRSELIRECQRLKPTFTKLSLWLEKLILNTQFLNTEG